VAKKVAGAATHCQRRPAWFIWLRLRIAMGMYAGHSPRRKMHRARAVVLGQWQANRAAVLHQLAARDCKVDYGGSDRTAYIVGLGGTARSYVCELIRQNMGRRAKYFCDHGIRCHAGPTSMIYSGHMTMRYVGLGQKPPSVTMRILEAVQSRSADLIFLYRHPLDSLLTNWVWWRTVIREHRLISGISGIYRNSDDLSSDLERNFSEFRAFAQGDPGFFTGLPNPPFLSFAQFVEETMLFLPVATLTLRLEDFMIDPLKEFLKIAAAMSVDLDTSHLQIARPRSKPFGYLAVKERVPQFHDYIAGLDAQTKDRIQRLGYDL
jgi:hypothetical protein